MIYKNKHELVSKWSKPDKIILDIGYWGQGKNINEDNAPHRLLQNDNKMVYGIDPVAEVVDEFHSRQSAENFIFNFKFDSIWALDLIEHLSNQGLFLDCIHKHLKDNGYLIITTPNCYNLFNIAEKITKYEPTTNMQHTCYHNHRTIRQLLERHSFDIVEKAYVYSLEYTHSESLKKKFLNIVYKILSLFTDKYTETLVIIAKIRR